MGTLSERQLKIVEIVKKKEPVRSSEVADSIPSVSFITIKRDLQILVKRGFLLTEGKGPATKYSLSDTGKFFLPVNSKEYCNEEPDKRKGSKSYDFDLFKKIPEKLFDKKELGFLEQLTKKYQKRVSKISETVHKKELERFTIELSWKSSRIEGNTYTLLDTERLLLEGIKAEGHPKSEAVMIINHKKAFDFIRLNLGLFNSKLKINVLEKIHGELVKDLNVEMGVRKSLVGITGSIYQPLDNEYQIKEALESFFAVMSKMKDPYSKALLCIMAISYIQPFADGNKRTARLLANAILLAHNCTPLSYRSVNEVSYREALLVFYELHSVVPIKNIFVEQYKFSAENYAVK